MKTENKTTTQVGERLNAPERKIPKEIKTEDIRRGVRSVTSVPTAAPRDFYESIVIYRSGGTNRLYIYDADNAEWLYETLTT